MRVKQKRPRMHGTEHEVGTEAGFPNHPWAQPKPHRLPQMCLCCFRSCFDGVLKDEKLDAEGQEEKPVLATRIAVAV